MIYYLFSLVFLLQAAISAEKVLIITTVYNRPDFIELQAKTFEKFLKDDYRFVVFNDARDKTCNGESKVPVLCGALSASIFHKRFTTGPIFYVMEILTFIIPLCAIAMLFNMLWTRSALLTKELWLWSIQIFSW